MVPKEYLSTADVYSSLSDEGKNIFNSIVNFCIFQCEIDIPSAHGFLEKINRLQNINDNFFFLIF